MDKHISNKVLVSFLLIVMVFSLFSIVFSIGKLGNLSSISGRQVYNSTQYSASNITILGVVGISVTGIIDFGDGSTAESSSILLATSSSYGGNLSNNTAFGFNDCSVVSGPCAGIVVENTGNVNANVTVNISKTAAQFIGGTNPSILHNATNGNTTGAQAGCLASELAPSTLTAFPFGGLKPFCGNLSYNDGSDKVTFELALVVPADAPPVTNSESTLTFFAIQR